MKRHKVGTERYSEEEIFEAILDSLITIHYTLKVLVQISTGKTTEELEKDIEALKKQFREK